MRQQFSIQRMRSTGVVVAILALLLGLASTTAGASDFPTIDGQSSETGTIAGGSSYSLQVTGRAGVPAVGAGAVALNVTVTNSTASSFLTAYPTGGARPATSNLVFGPAQTVPNMVVVKLGDSGQVSLFNYGGTVDVIVDVLGWFPADGSFIALSPSRLMDTRRGYPTIDGQFSGTGAVGAIGVANVTVTGRAGIPISGVGAVALNVTAVNPTAASFLTVWPAGVDRPTAANLNVVPGQSVSNMVLAKVGASGQLSIFNFAGSVDVVVDVLGWFPSSSSFVGVTPARLLDSRLSSPTVDGTFGGTGRLGANSTISVKVTGRGGVPETGVGAVALNVTATGPSDTSFLTVFPAGTGRPTAANLNVVPGQTVPNMTIVKVGAGGLVSLYNFAGSVDVIVDVLGWFPEGQAFTGLSPARLMDSRKIVPAAIAPVIAPTPAVTPAPVVATPVPVVAAPVGCPSGWYVNSSGVCVQSPIYAPTVPAGATAICRDGTYSFSQHRSGTCSHHGGVATWL